MPKYQRCYLEITNACNLACAFCAGNKRTPEYMSGQLFEQIISQLPGLVAELSLHVLGEPLLHPELIDFIARAERAGLPVVLTTNGALLSGNLAQELARCKLKQLNISLQAIDFVPDKTEYLNNIFNFCREFPRQNPQGYINLRLWNLLVSDNNWLIRELNQNFSTKIVLPTELTKFKDWKSHPLADRIYLHLDSQFTWPSLDQPIVQKQGFCYGLKKQFGILSDGRVVPCCLDSSGTITLGNIKETALAACLESERAKKMRRGFSQGDLVEPLCQRCGFINRFKAKIKKRTELD